MRFILGFLLLLAVSIGCNPVKKVLNDPAKMNEVATEMIRRGYCSNDTTIITQVTDTFFLKIEERVDTVIIGDGICSFDTTLSSGTRIKYGNGFLLINEKIRYKNRVITNRVDNYIRDTKFEDILKKDIEIYKDSVLELKTIIKEHSMQMEYLNGKLNKTNWYLILALVVIGISLLMRVYKFFKPLS
jgi:hypothetical protein